MLKVNEFWVITSYFRRTCAFSLYRTIFRMGGGGVKGGVQGRVSYRISFWGGGGEEFRKEGVHTFVWPQPFFWNHTHLIKNRLRSRISDINLGRLMSIAIEGPQLTEVNFYQLLETTKSRIIIISWGGGGGIPGCPYLCMKPCKECGER